MPKQVIRNHYYNAYPASEGKPGSAEIYPEYIHIGWTTDREHVEVATVNPKGRLAVHDTETDSWVPILEESLNPGWFVQLDRAGINAMIRTLRKARDAAFGSDE